MTEWFARSNCSNQNATGVWTKLTGSVPWIMNANELRRWLQARGCTIEVHNGDGGHLTVLLGDCISQLPMHGGSRKLGTRLLAKIKTDLGLQ